MAVSQGRYVDRRAPPISTPVGGRATLFLHLRYGRAAGEGLGHGRHCCGGRGRHRRAGRGDRPAPDRLGGDGPRTCSGPGRRGRGHLPARQRHPRPGRLGVGEAVRTAFDRQYTGGTRTPDGRWLARMDGARAGARLGTPIVRCPPGCSAPPAARGAARRMPDHRGRGEPVRRSEPGRPRVPLADGVLAPTWLWRPTAVDSRLRGQLFPSHPGPLYSGSTVLRAITEHPVPLRTDFELTWGRGPSSAHIAFADGRAEWHAVLNSPPGTRHTDALAEMRRRFSGWHDPIPALLDATRPDASCTTTSTNWHAACPPSPSAGSRSSATRRTP